MEILTEWYEKHARRLPWRADPTVYKTVVSEFMLQQTQVNTVLPFFEKWMRVLPNFESLAAATEETVLLLWSGLGYYSRARYLKQLASYFLEHNPQTYKEWIKIKGVGKYTAAAISSIAFNESVAVVDGNVVRVLSRIFNENTTFKNKSSAFTYFQPIAQKHLSIKNPGTHNQAMMELGATVCTTRCPLCQQCPVQTICLAYKNQTIVNCPSFIPAKTTKKTIFRVWVIKDGKILLQKIPSDKKTSLQGFYELPEFSETLQNHFKMGKLFFEKKRSIGRCTFSEKVFFAECNISHFSDANLQWLPLETLSSVPISGPHKRWINENEHFGFLPST